MDQLREDTRERTWEDYVETASAVLAVGAGAAFFLRNGGARQITKAASYLTEYRNSLTTQFLENPVTSFATMERTIRDNFTMAATEAAQNYTTRVGSIGSPLRSGVIGDVWGAVRRSIQGVTSDAFTENVLTAQRKTIAHNTLERIQQFAIDNDKTDLILSESELAALGRFADRAAASHTGISHQDMLTFLSETTDEEAVWQRASQYAEAIRNELARNEQKMESKTPWHFVEREIKNIAADGSVTFGKTAQEVTVDQNALALSKQVLDRDWQVIVEEQQKNKGFFSDLIDDVMGKQATMGELMDAYEQGDESAKVFFDSNKSWPVGRKSISKTEGPSELTNPLQELYEARKEMSATEKNLFDQIEIDTIRIQEGQFYSTKAINDARRGLLEDIGNTLPGRVFRLNDMLYSENLPTTHYFGAGTLDATLARVLGSSTKYTNKGVLYHRGRSYSVNPNGSLEEIKELRDFTLQSSRIGSQGEIFRAMNELSDGRDITDKTLDGMSFTIKQQLEEYGNNFDFFLDKLNHKTLQRHQQGALIEMEEYHGERGINRVSRFLNTMDRYIHADSFDTKAYHDMHHWYKNHSVSNEENHATITRIFDLLEKISKPSGEKDLYEFIGLPGSIDTAQSFRNPELKRLFSDFWKDPQRTLAQSKVHSDPAKAKDATAYVISYFPDNIRKELTKELFLQLGDEATGISAGAVESMINSALIGNKRRNARNLAAFAMFEEDIGRGSVGKAKKDIALDFIGQLNNIAANPTQERNKIVLDAFEDVRNRYNFAGEIRRIAPKKEAFENIEDFHYVHKTYKLTEQAKKAMDMVSNANAYFYDTENKMWHYDPIMAGRIYSKDLKAISKEFLKPITQFFSGNDAFDAYSESSHRGFHIMSRVNEQLKWTLHPPFMNGKEVTLDLRLQPKHAGSAAAIMSNLVLRRVAPLAMGMTALDWLDDATRYTTGVGIAEAGASGLANSYLGIKRITGVLGLDAGLKSLTSDNAIVKYWGGTLSGGNNPEWNTYEEQKDYYERGYTPIRKNRGWWFGSSNEIRGNKIAYFEPNTLRMLKSNYYMESMYNGSMWTKWSHSLMPTPTNPLSPLFYLADPYYLENLHKEDRPYPVTGSTFANNTPWGIALNPFFDTFIKPKKQMYRDRLNEDGIDVKALIAHVNEDIRRRSLSHQNDDVIYLQNGKLRSMLFTAFNAPTPSQRIIGSQGNSITMSTEYGMYGSGVEGSEYSALAEGYGDDGSNIAIGYSTGGISTEDHKLIGGQPVETDRLSFTDRLVLSAGKGNPVASSLVATMKQNGVFQAVRGANLNIKQRGALRKDQGLFYENKMQYEHPALEDMLANSETISDLMTQGKGSDYIREMTVATRNITGLYGYLASVMTGFGENNQKRIATSQNMESFSRTFWDMSIGGLDVPGSDVMEIARRFVPNYQRQAMVNPLMNNMPDWLPDRIRFGDPFASIPKGEARLPGKGYESLNQLHPDIYGRYGAFDRFKILADVAPYSPEYKFWKKIVGATIQDPELKKEIQEIKDRVAEQTKGHDFYDYKYIGRGMDQRQATITEVLPGGKFKVDGEDQIYKLSGVSVKAGQNGESTQEVLGRYLYAGQSVVLATDSNPFYARNQDKDHTINAGVLVEGENVAEQMLAAGEAKKRKGDTSAPSYMLKHGTIVNALNTVAEAIGHMDTPVWHSRALRIDSPLESYKDDYVYGTSYQSWSDVLRTFLLPNFQKFASSSSWVAIGIGAEILHNNVMDNGNSVQMLRSIAEGYLGRELKVKQWPFKLAAYTLNRGQLAGQLLGNALFMGASNSFSIIEKFKSAGSMVALGYAAAANPNNLAVSTMAWSRLGWKAAEMIQPNARGKAALAGAAIGVARWTGALKLLSSADNANTYIPDEAKQRWDMQEYFDRLTYIKYMGLYEQAADKAESEEGINVRKILDLQEKDREERINLKEELRQQLLDMKGNDQDAQAARSLIYRKLRESAPKIGIRGGEWTKTAIMYKNAADATMYGLSKNAVMEDIVRALPKTERDYFIEFMKEKDPEKREEILSTVSPMLNRALRTIWKMPLPDRVSNEEYFEHHTLPAPTWSGWRPDVDLANVEAKVIYNQGIKYSDMGIYASQYRTPEVQNAPNIEYDTSQNSTLWTRLKLQMAITGTGIDADSISVEPSPDSSIQVVANVARIIPYKINYEVDNFLRKI